MLTLDEIEQLKARAVYECGCGHRVRGWWARLMVTQLGDFFAIPPRLWPNGKRSLRV